MKLKQKSLLFTNLIWKLSFPGKNASLGTRIRTGADFALI